MNPRYLHSGLVAAALLLLVLALRQEATVDRAPDGAVQPRSPKRPHALAAVPKHARFVLNISLQGPGAAPLRQLLFNTNHELEGLGRLSEVCGYDPSPAIDELVITAFSDAQGTQDPGAEPQFAIVAAGSFDHERLVTCAKKLVSSRGGTPEHHSVKTLTLVRDRGRKGHEIAILERGVVLVANHESLRGMLDALDGHAPDISQNETHRSLTQALGKGPVAIATLDLGSDWLARLFDENDVSRSRLRGLEAAGLSLVIDENVSLLGALRCKTAPACKELAEFLRELVTQLSPLFQQSLGEQAFDNIVLKQNGATLELSWLLTPAALKGLIGRLTQMSPAGIAEPPPKAAPRGSAVPDETIFAKPASSH